MRDIKLRLVRFLEARRDWALTSEVAKAAKVSRVTIVQYLRELLGERLVEHKRLGKASMWRLSRASGTGILATSTIEASESIRAVQRERHAYLKIRQKLLADPRYAGKFVAVHKGRVIDADDSEKELVRRVYARHGYVPIYVEKLETERRVLEVPSPERQG